MFGSMFVSLPVWLSLGGAFGFVVSRYELSTTIRTSLAKSGGAMSASALLLGGVALSIVVAFVIIYNPLWVPLPVAELLLGAASGRWFASRAAGRDKMIFLGFAGALIVLAALQYDRGILNNITKFGAGTVSVEFSAQKSAQGSQSVDTSTNGSAFPGANRLDTVIDFYRGLGESIGRDDQYARIFAGPDPGLRHDPLGDERLGQNVSGFMDYSKKHIKRIGEMLYAVQSYQRSEESSFSSLTLIASKFRRAYQLALSGYNPEIIDIDRPNKKRKPFRS